MKLRTRIKIGYKNLGLINKIILWITIIALIIPTGFAIYNTFILTPKHSRQVYPDLEFVVIDDPGYKISIRDLTDPVLPGQKVKIYAKNSGQDDTGAITIHYDGFLKDNFIFRFLDWNIPKAPSGPGPVYSPEFNYLKALCATSEEGCSEKDIKEIPLGKVTINFEITQCKGCEKYLGNTIKKEYCIYKEDINICS